MGLGGWSRGSIILPLHLAHGSCWRPPVSCSRVRRAQTHHKSELVVACWGLHLSCSEVKLLCQLSMRSLSTCSTNQRMSQPDWDGAQSAKLQANSTDIISGSLLQALQTCLTARQPDDDMHVQVRHTQTWRWRLLPGVDSALICPALACCHCTGRLRTCIKRCNS